MHKRVLSFLFVLLFAVSLNTFAQDKTDLTLKGKVLGFNGKPMAAAAVYADDRVSPFFSNETLVKVGADGSFEIKITKSGIWSINFTGVGHSFYGFVVPVYGLKGTAEIEVKLAAQKSWVTPNKLLFKSNAGTEFYTPETVEISPNGKFSFTVNKALDTLLVQVVPKAFFPATGFEYPGASYLPDSMGGFHTAFFKVKPGFKVELDPKTLPRPYEANYPVVKFIADNSGLSDIYTLSDITNINYRKANAASFDESLKAFKNPSNPGLKDIAAARLFEWHSTPEQPYIQDFNGTIAAISPKNPAWATNMYGLRDIFEFMEPAKRSAYIDEIFSAHGPDTKVMLMYNLQELSYLITPEQFNALYEKLTKDADVIASGIDYSGLKPAGPKAPDQLHEFTVKLIDGKDFSPSQLKGKYFLIDFWGTWCAPCIEEIPYIEKAYEKFKGNGFEIISLAFSSPEEDFKARRKINPMPWLHALLSDTDGETIANLYNVEYIPKMLLVSPKGEIIGNEETLRDGGLMKKLEDIYK
ncbi:MAG: hypothetical protein HBSAPP04_06560 [Ignavibacteriaceae bacterium]|nr:MAG: hypothetical protein HBSAPP04_06560 [Ignavibacteriaceae bacterium]